MICLITDILFLQQNGEQLLQHELRKSQAIIKITHKKLQTYLTTLRKHTDPNQKTANDAQQVRKTLDDMEELCNFLCIPSTNINHGMFKTMPIDQAMEANETQQRTITQEKKRKSNLTLKKINIDEMKIDDDAVSPTLLSKTLYERPDSSSMHNSTLLQSDIKDFELMQITKAENAFDVVVADRDDSASIHSTTGSFPLANPLHAHKP